ncbi:MAG: hypothetical protein HDS57_04750 [Barnesiella sp.]|nr:hypothetical protein [Barnesiella sp.]
MGFFDDIAKKAKDITDSAAKSCGDAVKNAMEQASGITSKVSSTTAEIVDKVGDCASELTSKSAKGIGKGVSYLGETIAEAGEGDYTKLKGMASATGDFIVDAAKDMTGVNAYNHYQAAKQNREQADEIVKNVEIEVGKVRYLANERLQYMGKIRLEALRNSVGRFISIVERMNQGVRDKEYEMLTQIDITEGELKEMEIVAVDQKKMTSVVGIGASAAAAAAYGTQAAVKWGVQRFAAASTGTAIKQLSGAAAEKATMAWLGGGSVASGGGGVAAGASRMAMLGTAAAGVTILTTVATVASMYYSQKHTEATQYLADVKMWEAKTMSACELMKMIVRRSDEIATLTTRLETRCSDALDSLDGIADVFDSNNIAHVKTFQNAALLVKSVSQLCQTPLIDKNGGLNEELKAVTVSSEKVLNKNL